MKLTGTVQGVFSNLAAASKNRQVGHHVAGTWTNLKQFWSREWHEVSHRRLYAASAVATAMMFGICYTAIGHVRDAGSWQQVYSNGTYVGMVPNQGEVVGAMKRIALGYHVDVRFVPVQTHVSDTYDWGTVASLPTPAVAITLNGKPLVYTTSATDAQNVLNSLKTALVPKNIKDNAQVKFVGNVGVSNDVVSVTDILSKDAALRYLLHPSSAERTSRGESLASLADVGAPEQTKQAGNPALLQVSTSQTVAQEVNIPFTTQYISDSHLGKGAVSVVTQGKVGRAKEQVEQTFVNGKLVSSKILNKQITVQPRTEVAKQGTNPGVAVGSWGWPVASYTITSGYGWRFGGAEFHPGIDIGCPIGTPVYASNNGVVENAGWNSGGYGNWIRINNGGGLESIFGHLSRVAVHAGQMVSKGQLIGYSGSTGESTGPHLHYEIRRNGTHIDPHPYM